MLRVVLAHRLQQLGWILWMVFSNFVLHPRTQEIRVHGLNRLLTVFAQPGVHRRAEIDDVMKYTMYFGSNRNAQAQVRLLEVLYVKGIIMVEIISITRMDDFAKRLKTIDVFDSLQWTD